MQNAERCRERSEECKRKAEAVSDARDRAKWLELADGWIGLSRIPFHPGPKAHYPKTSAQRVPAGIWVIGFPLRRKSAVTNAASRVRENAWALDI